MYIPALQWLYIYNVDAAILLLTWVVQWDWAELQTIVVVCTHTVLESPPFWCAESKPLHRYISVDTTTNSETIITYALAASLTGRFVDEEGNPSDVHMPCGNCSGLAKRWSENDNYTVGLNRGTILDCSCMGLYLHLVLLSPLPRLSTLSPPSCPYAASDSGADAVQSEFRHVLLCWVVCALPHRCVPCLWEEGLLKSWVLHLGWEQVRACKFMHVCYAWYAVYSSVCIHGNNMRLAY